MDDAVFDLSERQHSLVASHQLLALGLSSQTIWRMRSSEDWTPRTSKVLARRGAEDTFHGRLMAAVLDAGPAAFLSGASAAALWRLSGFGVLHLRHIDVTRPRGGSRRRSELANIHEVLDLEADHTTVLDGIPVSTATRTVFELAATRAPARAERACDNAWARNLTSRRLLHRMLDDWADRGRAGTVVMRDILERRPAGYVPPASNLESRFAHLAERHCIGPFRRQVNLGGEEWIGRVDFLHARCPLVVEVLSQEFHAALFDQAADERRFELLDEAGFTVVPVWDHELWGDARAAMRRVEVAEADLLARQRAA
jgi:very-short-patch-repair endonuclease